jgi:hypothetical protein
MLNCVTSVTDADMLTAGEIRGHFVPLTFRRCFDRLVGARPILKTRADWSNARMPGHQAASFNPASKRSRAVPVWPTVTRDPAG